jgi:hypothetical protein
MNTIGVSPCFWVNTVETIKDTQIQLLVIDSEYIQRIVYYLTSLKQPRDLFPTEFFLFKRDTFIYNIRDSKLFKIHSKDKLPILVIENYKDQIDIIDRIYTLFGYKDIESIYRKITDRFWWKDLFKDIYKFV